MKNNPSEDIVTKINQNVFFKEFTFEKNDFKVDKEQLELADNVVWLDDIFFIFQIKDRLPAELGDDEKWFKKKVLDKAVKQIKNTLDYLSKYPEINIKNKKGHQLNVAKADPEKIQKIIVYTPGDQFPEEKRNLKFHKSNSAGLIHLFHSEDYYWICKYLLTPAEVEEYLDFRENLFKNQERILVHLPEQYVLGHFLETLDVDHIEPRYINNLQKLEEDGTAFDMSGVIETFNKTLTLSNGLTEYYTIIAEIAKLNRAEMAEFKKRFLKSTEVCKQEEIVTPYRIYIPRTDCGFVFIPLPKDKAQHWKTAITNLTLAQKYDQKAKKCLGVVVLDMVKDKEQYFNCYWMFVEAEWKFDPAIESQLAKSFPFRQVKTKKIDNRYFNS